MGKVNSVIEGGREGYLTKKKKIAGALPLGLPN